jgi:hypothetical protein
MRFPLTRRPKGRPAPRAYAIVAPGEFSLQGRGESE